MIGPASRLCRCISSVFPSLGDEALHDCDLAQLLTADSLAAVTLVAVIEEEFGVGLDPEQLFELGSVQAIGDYLRKHGLPNLATESRVSS